MKHWTDFQGSSEDDGGQTAAPATGDPGDVVTQADLRRYMDLSRRLRLLDAEWKALRNFLLSQLDAGTLEEDGPLRVRVAEWSQRRFSAQNLALLLGPEEVERLKAQLEPTVCRRLDITDSGR